MEFDPAVYFAARHYFYLPEPNAVFLQDANEFVQRCAERKKEEKFDYVIHDVFTGGAVAGELFTVVSPFYGSLFFF